MLCNSAEGCIVYEDYEFKVMHVLPVACCFIRSLFPTTTEF
jgi:hypothetical protein